MLFRSIPSDLVPQGGADLILSLEPLESLRYAAWLSPKGALISAAEPFVNIPNYPDVEGILKEIKAFPLSRIVEAASLAKEAGFAKSGNMVMVGTASPFLPIKIETLEKTIEKMFAGKNPQASSANKKALHLGRDAVK